MTIPDGFGPPPVATATVTKKRINVQTKGKSGEREALGLIRAAMERVEAQLRDSGLRVRSYSDDVKRNTMQSDRGGYDIHGVPLLALEIKRCETLQLDAWWRQAVRQATSGELPVLMFRRNKERWRVQTWACLTSPNGAGVRFVPAVVTIEEFVAYFETMYAEYLRGSG